jgi:hypothetical protein
MRKRQGIIARIKERARKKVFLVQDEFSRDLASQGEDGKILSMLYLRNPMDTYIRKVNDESIQH